MSLSNRPLLPLRLAVFLGVIPLLPANAEFIISEFLASNSGAVLSDEDGAPSDWIEIYNPDPTAKSLAGYGLSDSAGNLKKWTFPDVTVPPGGYLVVFASAKDRAVAGSELHTNFSLSSSGEFLGLTKPDGATLVSSYAPSYPQQFEDTSYGLGNGGPVTPAVFLAVGSALTYLVPSSDIGSTWQLPGFDDSSWTDSHSAVGFGYNAPVGDTIPADGDVKSEMLGKNASIYLRIPLQITDPAEVIGMTFKSKVDDGFVAYLNGQKIASKNAPSPLTFDSGATSGEEVEPGDEFEVFPVSFAGKLVAGENIIAIQAMNSSAGSSDFIIIPELEGKVQDLTVPPSNGFFVTPTPESPNGPPAGPPPVQVQFDSTSRVFSDSFTLTLSHPDPTATVYYTTDGSLPTPDSATPYAAPLAIDSSTLVRARAFKVGLLNGIGRSEGFMKISSDRADFSSDLPIVLLSTFGKGGPPGTDSTTRKDTFMLIYEPDSVSGRATFSGTPAISTRGGFKKRGSSSAGFAKYAMSFESWDEFDEDKDIEPLGMAPEADWILNSRFQFDLTLMRNTFTYELSNQMGRWAVKTRFVELFNDISGSEVTASDYSGVYTFMEKIEIDRNRVDIKKTRPWETSEPEITGGYIFKNDRPDPGEPTFNVSGFSRPLVHVDPDGLKINSAQKSYLTKFSNEATTALRRADGINPSTGKHFSEYLDVDSFIDNFWLNVLVMDPDWGRLSQFFYKDREGKINAGPAWDYDRTMGSRDDRDDNPRRWEAPTSDTSYTWFDSQYEWFGLLFGFNSSHNRVQNMPNPQLITSRPDIFQKVIDRWYELRGSQFADGNIDGIVSGMASQIEEAQARNFVRWTTYTPGQISGMNFAQPGTSGWNREVSHLKGWLAARTGWIDSRFFAPPTLNQAGGAVPVGFSLTFSAPKGTVYYTLDGSDPRAPGGAPAAGAIAGNAVTLNNTVIVTARAYDGQQWGAPAAATFVVGAAIANADNLVISEIMYHPAEPTVAEIAAGFDTNIFFEYLELLNISGTIVDLTGVSFTAGLDFDFTGSGVTTLAPGGRALIVRSVEGFRQRYGTGLDSLIAGTFANDSGLSGSGEQLILTGLTDTIRDFEYDDKFPWPEAPDGSGPSIVLVSPFTNPDASIATNWRSSVGPAGSAGVPDGIAFTGDPNADLDGDGFNAFAEYAFGTSDTVANAASEILVAGTNGSGRFTVSYPVNLAADDALVSVEVSSDLKTWTPAGDTLKLADEIHGNDGRSTFTLKAPNPAAPMLFVRLHVTSR